MYEERKTKVIHMTLEEFKKWEVPEGWHIVRMNAEWQRTAPYAYPPYVKWEFDIRVTIEEGVNIHAIL